MTLVIDSRRVPVEKKALELAQEGIIPGGAYNNRGYLQDDVEMGSGVSLELSDVLYDPQTAGGLLISLPEHKAPELLRQLEEFTGDACLVGYVKPFDGKSIVVKEKTFGLRNDQREKRDCLSYLLLIRKKPRPVRGFLRIERGKCGRSAARRPLQKFEKVAFDTFSTR